MLVVFYVNKLVIIVAVGIILHFEIVSFLNASWFVQFKNVIKYNCYLINCY